MLMQGQCQHCAGIYEYEAGSKSEFCPHCGKETLCAPPKRESKTSGRSKIPTGVWIGTGVVVLCAVCIASILIGKNLQKRSDQTSQTINENGDPTKTPDYPPPPTSRMEFTANILKNFPEKVEGVPGTLEGKFGWMDGRYMETRNDEIENIDGIGFDASTKAGFYIQDKNGDFFERCYLEKSKLGDTLLGLKQFDKIRISGQAIMILRPGTDALFDAWFRVDSIQVIK